MNPYAALAARHSGKVAITDLSPRLENALPSIVGGTVGTILFPGYGVLAGAGGAVVGILVADRVLPRVRAIVGEIIPKEETYTDHATVLAVQKALQAKGFDPGPIDGEFGPKTSNAIKKMQAAVGAAQTGMIDWGVLSALRVPAPREAKIIEKNQAQDLPNDGRPAKGWSQPVTQSSTATPSWQAAVGIVAALIGLIAISTGLYLLVKR